MQKSLVKAWLIGLGMGMIILWIADLASYGAPWLTWLDFAGAIVSISLAALLKPQLANRALDAGIVVLAFSLFVFWLIGLVTQLEPMLVWWNFAFAVAYLLLGVASISKEGEETGASQFPPRKAA